VEPIVAMPYGTRVRRGVKISAGSSVGSCGVLQCLKRPGAGDCYIRGHDRGNNPAPAGEVDDLPVPGLLS